MNKIINNCKRKDRQIFNKFIKNQRITMIKTLENKMIKQKKSCINLKVFKKIKIQFFQYSKKKYKNISKTKMTICRNAGLKCFKMKLFIFKMKIMNK